MTSKRLGRKFLKITGFVLGSVLILLTAFHFWFVNHAEEILQDLVADRSNGKLRLEVKKFRFNWFSKKMELLNVEFSTTDTINVDDYYRFAVKKIKIKVKAILPMIFEKRVMINLLNLEDADVTVTHLRNTQRDTTKERADVSIPQVMGKIYNSIQDAIQVLKVKKFELDNASLTLINKADPQQHPMMVSNIDFHIDNLKIDSSDVTGKEKIFFSDNIVLKSKDQVIIFPDGRHKLSFEKFRINIEKKIVEFDSCTIAAIKKDSADVAFSIFFDALVMTNIDFDTLYRAEVIKADSVYAVNPKITLDVDLGVRSGPGKPPPKLDQIFRQLTGDLLLNFVVVNNASIDIRTVRNGRPSSFTSQENNFEMQGLSIDKKAARPLRVKKFAMAIRNYENFLRDSTYEMQFDSVFFNDDKILLNNFSFRHLQKNNIVNSFNIPSFQLTGLSWEDLLFEQKLTAQQATLYNPVINYQEAPKKYGSNGNRNIFEVLANINEVMMLEDMKIINGNIDLRLNGGIDVDLKNATISVESRALLGSDKLSGIRRSVNYLDFKKGLFRIRDLTVTLDDIKYTGVDSRLKATQVTAFNESRSINALASNVEMDEIIINENTGDVTVGGIRWEKADIKISGIPVKKETQRKSFIRLTGIRGNNTKLSTSWGGKQASLFIDHVEAPAFQLEPGEKPIITGLVLSGKNMEVNDARSHLAIKAINVSDKHVSFFDNIQYNKSGSSDSIDMRVDRISLIPDIQSAVNGEVRANDISILKPVVHIARTRNAGTPAKSEWTLPVTRLDKLFIQQPEIHFVKNGENGRTQVSWRGKNAENNSIVLMDVDAGGSLLSAKQLHLSLNHFLVEQPNGKKFDAGDGEISALLENFSFQKTGMEDAEWKATIAHLDGKNFQLDSLGKRAGRLDMRTVQLRELSINSSSLLNIRKMVAANQKFRIQNVTGGWLDQDNQFSWFNAGYDKGSKYISADSFFYNPTLTREEFIASHPYQTDYIQVKTGSIKAGPFDADKYLKDSIVGIGELLVNDVVFNDYRDNRPPFRTGIIKPLIVDQIKGISFKVSIDTILVNNASVTYAELNPKTRQTGVIPVSRMVVKAFPVRNFNLNATDSLSLHAHGYLMDSIWIRLRLRESYIDSLSGFFFTIRMQPADMRLLNPALGPLASVKLRSGHLDTISMRVGGGEFLAYGETEMFYKDLKIQLVKNQTLRRTGFLNFIINFVIKNKNTRRTGNVFFIRDRERSSLNYLIKIFMSGVTSSVGARGNRKVYRKYQRELRQRQLPPVDFE